MQHFDKREMGIRIKELRKRQELTQQEMAEILCYATERQLQRIENGEICCPVDRLADIAQILHTTTDYLLFGTGIACKVKDLLESDIGGCKMILVIKEESDIVAE